MAKVHKTVEQARANLAAAAPSIGARYKEQTQKANWADAAMSNQAKENYSVGIQEAIASGKREANIAKVGDAKYRKGCAEKGAAVIGQRVTAALPQYVSGITPTMNAAIQASDSAPARTRDYVTNVTNRLLPVVAAMKAAAGKK